MMADELFTIGYSGHSIESFVDALKNWKITALADVRSVPFSRFSPAFNKDVLSAELKKHGIEYVFLGQELGARRSNPACYINGKAVYELIENDIEYIKGITRITNGIKKFRISMMCSEKDPLFCHRAILVSKTLSRRNVSIMHIRHSGDAESHSQLEKRLLNKVKMIESDFFLNSESLLDKAYRIQGQHIAYQDEKMESDESEAN